NAPPVLGDADAVHPGATGDRDSPAALGSGPQHGIRVVPDDDLGSPAASLGFRAVGLLLIREVEACDEEKGKVGRRAALRGELVDPAGPRRDADVVRMAEGAADEAEDGSVLLDESGIGLRAAAVDGEDRFQWTASDTSPASRPSRSSAWPISGCASSAFRAS